MNTELSDHPTPDACLNCGDPLAGQFCANCGQRTDTGRLRISTWASDFFGLATTLESGFLRTVIELTLHPGRTAQRYVAGQRTRFTSPIRSASSALNFSDMK